MSGHETMTALSLFAGIGGFDLGAERAGIDVAWQCEIDPRCRSVLGRHFPKAEQFDDVREFAATTIRPGLICGGFPCQDLSVAGRRAGLAGERSGLWWEFRRIIAECSPRWVCIENVPGLLSSWSPTTDPPSGVPTREDIGRRVVLEETSDFYTVTQGLSELGYGWAMRVFDSQWFGVPQRRRRVFIVGCLGDMRGAAEVLFEPEGLPWDSPPSRKAGARVASCVRGGIESGSNESGNKIEVANCIQERYGKGPDSDCTSTLVSHTLRAEGPDASEDGTGRGTPLVPVAFDTTQLTSPDNRSNPQPGDPCHPLAHGQHAPAVAFQCQGTNVGPLGSLRRAGHNETNGVPFTFETRVARNGRGQPSETVASLVGSESGVHGDSKAHVAFAGGVRRLTPRECERLQSFLDDWTRWGRDGEEMSDSARYRMLGNAVTVNVAEWIVRRIAEKHAVSNYEGNDDTRPLLPEQSA